MSHKLTIAYFLIIVLYCRCKHSANEIVLSESKHEHIKKIDITNLITDSVFHRYIKPINAISMHGNDSIYVTNFKKILRYKEKFVFGDLKLSSLMILDSTGHEIAKVGGIGTQENQYLSLEDFNIDQFRDEIKIFSNESHAIFTYSLKGDFIRKDQLNFYAYRFSILDSSHLVFFLNQNTSKKSGDYNMLITGNGGNVIQRLFPITRLPHLVIGYSGFLQKNDQSILYGEPFSDSIYEINAGNYAIKYVVPLGNKIFKPSKKMSDEAIQHGATKHNWLLGPVYESDEYFFLFYKDGQLVHPIATNKATGKSMDGRTFKNKIIQNLLFNVCGQNEGVFYSVVDFDIIYPLLKENPGEVAQIEKFDTRLFSKLNGEFPMKEPVIFAFKFIF
jgi:hypothetical protein